MTADEFEDPLRPSTPTSAGDLGRVFAHGRIEAGWPCRWCRGLLASTPAGAVVCLACDYPTERTPK